MRITAFISKLTRLPFWHRCVFLMLIGVLGTLSLAPTYVTPLLIPAFSLLFLLNDHAKNCSGAFLSGWCFGFGFFLTGIYWFSFSLLVDSERFAWMIPFATVGMASVLAVFYGIACLLYRIALKTCMFPSITARVMLFAVCCAVGDLPRSYVLTGLPWNAIGYSWAVHEVPLQLASIIGIHGLNMLTVLFATLPVLFCYQTPNARRIVGASALVLMVILFWGYTRLSAPVEIERSLNVRMVQGNVTQKLKHNKNYHEAALQNYMEMTTAQGKHPVDLVVWPEASFPYILYPDSEWIDTLASLISPKTTLLTGAKHAEGTKKEDFRLWNSLAMIESSGEIEFYDKHRLVPFGEFIPMRDILRLDKITSGRIDYTAGIGKRTLTSSNNIKIGPLICYESVYSRHAFFEPRPDVLINISNDGWFGNSPGPFQHLYMTRMRAVEQGTPLVRVANTGVSAVFDEKGRFVEKIGMNEKGARDVAVVLAKDSETIYSKYGLGVFTMLAMGFLVTAFSLRKHNEY